MRREWLRLGGVLVVVLLALGLFREYRLRKEVELRTENQYQRAFQEVVYHLDGLEQELGKAAASGSMVQVGKAFADAWRHTESARAAIGQLPITNVPLSSTEGFLANVAAFTYTLSQKGASGETLEDREWAVLRDLQEQARLAASELARMGRAFASGALRWTDVQRDLAAAAAVRVERTSEVTPSGQITKGFKMLEDGMSRFPSPDIEGVLPPPRVKLPAIPGRAVSTDEAIRMALDFLGPEGVAGRTARVVSRVPSEPEVYRIELVRTRGPRGGEDRIVMDVSVQGGRVLWMIDESPVGPATIAPAAAEAVAARFLESRGFAGMRKVSRQAYEGVAAVGFAYEQNGVLVYPDRIVVRVALDDGRVTGFEGTSYQVFHRVRPLGPPRVTETQARSSLNPRLDVRGVRLAVIMDDFYEEKLVYEFEGRIADETYLVYVNAETGKEEEVKKATPTGIEAI